jgi:hypothetical protein
MRALKAAYSPSPKQYSRTNVAELRKQAKAMVRGAIASHAVALPRLALPGTR